MLAALDWETHKTGENQVGRIRNRAARLSYKFIIDNFLPGAYLTNVRFVPEADIADTSQLAIKF